MLGLVLSRLGVAGVRRMLSDADRLTGMNLDLLLLTFGIAVLSAILAGLYPTWRVCQMAPAGYLKTQ